MTIEYCQLTIVFPLLGVLKSVSIRVRNCVHSWLIKNAKQTQFDQGINGDKVSDNRALGRFDGVTSQGKQSQSDSYCVPRSAEGQFVGTKPI